MLKSLMICCYLCALFVKASSDMLFMLIYFVRAGCDTSLFMLVIYEQ